MSLRTYELLEDASTSQSSVLPSKKDSAQQLIPKTNQDENETSLRIGRIESSDLTVNTKGIGHGAMPKQSLNAIVKTKDNEKVLRKISDNFGDETTEKMIKS